MFEIGSTLREARVRRNLSLQQVEEDTKIRAKYVQAMENEDFDIMPGPTYVKGFLRTYSTYLGLDPRIILDEYRSRDMPSNEIHEPFGGVSMLGAPRSHRRRNTIVVVAVVCLLALAAIWVLGEKSQPADPTTEPGVLGITSTSPSPSPSPSPSVSTTASPRPAKGEVRIAATEGDCWIEVRQEDADGKVLFSGTMKRGQSKVIMGKLLWLRLGNPMAVRIRVDGVRVGRIEEAGPIDFLVRNGKLTRID